MSVERSNRALLGRHAAQKGLLDDDLLPGKTLSPGPVVLAMFSQYVLTALGRELKRGAPARVELQVVFNAIRQAVSVHFAAENEPADKESGKSAFAGRSLAPEQPNVAMGDGRGIYSG